MQRDYGSHRAGGYGGQAPSQQQQQQQQQQQPRYDYSGRPTGPYAPAPQQQDPYGAPQDTRRPAAAAAAAAAAPYDYGRASATAAPYGQSSSGTAPYSAAAGAAPQQAGGYARSAQPAPLQGQAQRDPYYGGYGAAAGRPSTGPSSSSGGGGTGGYYDRSAADPYGARATSSASAGPAPSSASAGAGAGGPPAGGYGTAYGAYSAAAQYGSASAPPAGGYGRDPYYAGSGSAVGAGGYGRPSAGGAGAGAGAYGGPLQGRSGVAPPSAVAPYGQPPQQQRSAAGYDRAPLAQPSYQDRSYGGGVPPGGYGAAPPAGGYGSSAGAGGYGQHQQPQQRPFGASYPAGGRDSSYDTGASARGPFGSDISRSYARPVPPERPSARGRSPSPPSRRDALPPRGGRPSSGYRDRVRERSPDRERAPRERSPDRDRDRSSQPPASKPSAGSATTASKPAPAKPSEPDYVCRLPFSPMATPHRGYTTLKMMYKSLHIVQDFSHLHVPGLHPEQFASLPLYQAPPINLDFDGTGRLPDVSDEPVHGSLISVNSSPVAVKFYVRVALIGEDPLSTGGGPNTNPIDRLRFLVMRKDKKVLLFPGGAWNETVDGGDPTAEDDGALIRTAIRTTREFTQLDLSQCNSWIRFMEIHYHRPAEEVKGEHFDETQEVTVVYIPNLWATPIDREQFESTYKLFSQQESDKKKAGDKAGDKPSEKKPADAGEKDNKEADAATSTDAAVAASTEPTTTTAAVEPEIKVPEESTLLAACPRSNHTLRLVSLNGLLDYKPSDVFDRTFEISVFAEAYLEALQFHFGTRIMHCLHRLPTPVAPAPKEDKREAAPALTAAAAAAPANDKKRPAEEEEDKKAEDAQPAKVARTDDVSEGEQKAVEEGVKPQEEAKEEEEEVKPHEDAKDEEEEKKEEEHQPMEVEEQQSNGDVYKPHGDVLDAFRFYDQNNTGFLRRRDLLDIMWHVNTEFLAIHELEDLADRLPKSENGARVLYKKLFDEVAPSTASQQQ